MFTLSAQKDKKDLTKYEQHFRQRTKDELGNM